MERAESTAEGGATAAEFARIVEVCDRFGSSVACGERPRIEEFLGRNPWLPRRGLFRELLALEIELARTGGTEPITGDYRARFPDSIQVLEDVFAQEQQRG